MSEPTNPLKGRTGVTWVLLDDLDDDRLEQYIAYWEARYDELLAQDDGYAAWWCSKHISLGLMKRAKRPARP